MWVSNLSGCSANTLKVWWANYTTLLCCESLFKKRCCWIFNHLADITEQIYLYILWIFPLKFKNNQCIVFGRFEAKTIESVQSVCNISIKQIFIIHNTSQSITWYTHLKAIQVSLLWSRMVLLCMSCEACGNVLCLVNVCG